jgi:hypothetical protein
MSENSYVCMVGLEEKVSNIEESRLIQVRLDGELLDRFKTVKKGLGVRTDSEVLRIALWHYFRTGAYLC